MSHAAVAVQSEEHARSRTETAVHFEDVWKSYRRFSLFGKSEEHFALRGISLAIERGETIGLLGPNGAGKTTLLKIITTLIWPTSGRVTVNGIDTRKHSADARRQMGLVTCDERSFYWRLTAIQNLRFFATIYGVPAKQMLPRIEELLAALDLSDAADRPYQSYSAGMKQKMAIARGLLANPNILLYDEPTRSLDPLSTYNIRQWIVNNRLKHPDQTHIIATHQLTEAEQLCDRVLIVNKGTIVAEGPVNEIRDRYRVQEYDVHHVTYSAREPIDIVGGAHAGVMEVELDKKDASEFRLRITAARDSAGLTFVLDQLIRAKARIIRCENEQPSFDDIFCSVILGARKQEKENA